MKYDEMSDFDINTRLASILGVKWQVSAVDGDVIMDCESWDVVDYCNSPSDAWPIITENRIFLMPTTESDCEWEAAIAIEWDSYIAPFMLSCESVSKNPLRAAMICFLKIKDSERK